MDPSPQDILKLIINECLESSFSVQLCIYQGKCEREKNGKNRRERNTSQLTLWVLFWLGTKAKTIGIKKLNPSQYFSWT